MSSVLVLTSSALGDDSVSNQLVNHAVEQIVRESEAATVVRRNLGLDPVPHLVFDSTAAVRGGSTDNDAQKEALALSDSLVAELKAADTVVIGAPMYNFGMPTTLKAWFDHVLRAGVTFSYSEAGPKGLLEGKKAIVVLSRGGLYSEGPSAAIDFQEPHLRWLLKFMGIEDVVVVRAEKLGFGPEAREQAITGAKAAIEASLRDENRLAA